jgi:pSer/pThr/pTyr-binding forkhead associated (FHA) protein
MAQMTGPGQQNDPPERSGTVLETDEDVRRAMAEISGLKGQPQSAPAATSPVSPPGRSASTFRPAVRPPIAALTVFDDGKTEGEVIRIRQPKFTIGRAEGDLRIPIDGRISSRHVEISLQTVGGLHRWVVTDLQSTHGLFVRVHKTVLADEAEFLVGNGRYRFDAARAGADSTTDHAPGQPATGETRGWDDGPSPVRMAALTELIGNEIGNRILLVRPEYWIGSDPTCSIARPDDPYCEPRHVRLYRGTKGGWHAEHNKTGNGLWLRMSQITVDSKVEFQIGEQRFRLKV